MKDPRPSLAHRSPLVRIFAFLGGLAIIWLPLALPLYWLSKQGRLPGGDTLPLALLYVFFLLAWPLWGRRVYGLKRPFQTLGLVPRLGVVMDVVMALLLGFAGIAVLGLVEILCGWAVPQAPSANLLSLLLTGAVTGLGVGFAEELLFRGWLLYELEQGYSPAVALWVNALVFAGVHFIKPWSAILATLPQFFGLLLLGLTLVWARRSPSQARTRERITALGFPLGLHGGLVWGYFMLSAGGLVELTQAAPAWMTGINGNPLAGVLGLVLLGGLAGGFYGRSHPRLSPPPL